uniref:WW domain-containing protein n=1 Tax=Ganoderma boninense TaxID=34458 RepID=A0A5K1K382_9APHY|nr:WW domain-containing protein [Ganoderma boninense]
MRLTWFSVPTLPVRRYYNVPIRIGSVYKMPLLMAKCHQYSPPIDNSPMPPKQVFSWPQPIKSVAPTTVYNKGLQPADKDRVVERVVATASAPVSAGKNEKKVFHWRLYLVLAPAAAAQSKPSSTKSILFDMSPTTGGLTGTFIIASKVDAQSRSREKIELQFPTHGHPTVAHFIDLFLEKGMDRYNFNDKGMGCYHWTVTGIQHLEEAGMLTAGSAKSLDNFYKQQGPQRCPVANEKGQFYWCVANSDDSERVLSQNSGYSERVLIIRVV